MSLILDYIIMVGDFVAQCMFIGVMAAVGISLITFAIALCVWSYRKIRYHW